MTRRLREFLEHSRVPYEVLRASEDAYTAQEVAARLHVSGNELLKPVVLKADGRLVLAVVPAARRVDVRKAAELVGAKQVSLAPEGEFTHLFEDCDAGAEPPFGDLYGVETLLDDHVLGQAQVAFMAGTHHEAVQMGRADYERLARPKVGDLCQPWQ